jgi:hypothetical protein
VQACHPQALQKFPARLRMVVAFLLERLLAQV